MTIVNAVTADYDVRDFKYVGNINPLHVGHTHYAESIRKDC